MPLEFNSLLERLLKPFGEFLSQSIEEHEIEYRYYDFVKYKKVPYYLFVSDPTEFGDFDNGITYDSYFSHYQCKICDRQFDSINEILDHIVDEWLFINKQ